MYFKRQRFKRKRAVQKVSCFHVSCSDINQVILKFRRNKKKNSLSTIKLKIIQNILINLNFWKLENNFFY